MGWFWGCRCQTQSPGRWGSHILPAMVSPHPVANPVCFWWQHGGIYVKRSAKFNEKEMRGKLLSYVQAGTPVSAPTSLCPEHSDTPFL